VIIGFPWHRRSIV